MGNKRFSMGLALLGSIAFLLTGLAAALPVCAGGIPAKVEFGRI
jgi:hypothetical protein